MGRLATGHHHGGAVAVVGRPGRRDRSKNVGARAMVSVTFEPRSVNPRKSKLGARLTPEAPAPRPWVRPVALLLVGLGLGATVGVTLTAETLGELKAPGGIAIFLGGLTGLVGMYLALVMVLLISRIPAVERVLGLDGLVRWHRGLAPWPISLLVAHAVIITIGYAQSARAGVWHEFGTLVTGFPFMLIATVGLGFMVMAAVISIRAIRSRLRRETWWVIHLSMYLALALSFAHVIALGPSFVGHPLTRWVWSVAWASTAGVVLVYRIGLPIFRSLRHGLRVVQVKKEAPGVTTVICSGRNVERLAVSGGQFFSWRFLVPGMWWQAHPYSMSALPRPPYLRLTVKNVGDHSAAVAKLRPGVRVAIEGPYGAFTRHAQRHTTAVLIAAGIGITALRALLEDLPSSAQPVVIIRASREEDLCFRSEVTELVKQRRGKLHELVGPRHQVLLDRRSLPQLVPDLLTRDVYVCGPDGFVADVVRLVGRLGVPEEAIHHEAFSL
ncbi:MAG TPA: ferredoxin reductase family protein [Acidimicrobiales bacterium]|nr:ferredoxin reductase family protein [Acidimicrobiales bacterium]